MMIRLEADEVAEAIRDRVRSLGFGGEMAVRVVRIAGTDGSAYAEVEIGVTPVGTIEFETKRADQ